jgi:hypothetical protein
MLVCSTFRLNVDRRFRAGLQQPATVEDTGDLVGARAKEEKPKEALHQRLGTAAITRERAATIRRRKGVDEWYVEE